MIMTSRCLLVGGLETGKLWSRSRSWSRDLRSWSRSWSSKVGLDHSPVWIPCIWTGPPRQIVFHSSIYWWMALAWCCQQWFSFYQSWFPCHNQQLFSPDFHWVVTVLLHCLPEDWYRQQTTSHKAVIFRWTPTTVRCQLLLHHYCEKKATHDSARST